LKSFFYILFFTLLSFEGFSQINFPALSGRNGNLLPTLATTAATSITSTSADSGGNISSNGGSDITFKGICWSTVSNPTIANSKTSISGPVIGSFTSSLTGLTTGTTYYVRAYATNIVGTGYGNQVTFKTNSVPVLSRTNVTASTTPTRIYWYLDNSGGQQITVHGLCWTKIGTPTISDNFSTYGYIPSVSEVNLYLSSTKFYDDVQTESGIYYKIRPYATNSIGTGYGPEITVIKPAPPVLTTTAASSIKPVSAISGGNITSDGGSSVTTRGVVWSTVSSPTISSYLGITTNGSGTGAFTSTITGLSPSTIYYVRSYATNSKGTSYGNEISFTTSDLSELQIGDLYGGGIVAYIYRFGDVGYVEGETHGLIAQLSDLNRYTWSDAYNYALMSNVGGFNNWHLPTFDELKWLYWNIGPGNALGLGNIGNFELYHYWSQTDYYWEGITYSYTVWVKLFHPSSQNADEVEAQKNGTIYFNTRAVRSF